MTPITTDQLTEATLAGNGVFDTLMRANKAHLDAQYDQGRLRGPEYAQVYLGSLQAVLAAATQFLLAQQKTSAEVALVEAQRLLVEQQTANAVAENAVLVAQECKLRAEYDVTILNKALVTAQTSLTNQKTASEKAQTISVGVDADSVIGKQKTLYQAQTDGFKRDAEQKAASLLVDTWKARRMTDEATVADGTNLLNDATIGRAITKVLAGVGA